MTTDEIALADGTLKILEDMSCYYTHSNRRSSSGHVTMMPFSCNADSQKTFSDKRNSYTPQQLIDHWADTPINSNCNRFQYVLVAPTSPSSKLGEESLTCLNQGQSYELKLRKLQEDGVASSQPLLKSIVRIIFHDRRLQYDELQQLRIWQHNRPGEQFIDIDMPLSCGLTNVEFSDTNNAKITWDARQEASVFIRVNCISTEFTVRQRGGEKGLPFRIQVETYLLGDDVEQPIHCASCKIKVFKPKGAERKNKTDLEKFYQYTEAEKALFHPAADTTVLTEMSIAQAVRYVEQRKKSKQFDEHSINASKSESSSQKPPADAVGSSLTPLSCAGLSSCDESSDDAPCNGSFKLNLRCEANCSPPEMTSEKVKSKPFFHSKVVNGHQDNSSIAFAECCEAESSTNKTFGNEHHGHSTVLGPQISPLFNSEQVMHWLETHRFHRVAHNFCSYTGIDMLKLSRDDFITLCGPGDGIRLNNAILSKSIRPRRTIYLCLQNGDQLPGLSPHVLTNSWCACRRSNTNSSSDSSRESPVTTCSSIACDIQHDVSYSSMLNNWPPPSFFSLNECFVDVTPSPLSASSRSQLSHQCDAFGKEIAVSSTQRPQQQPLQQTKRKHNDVESELDKKTCHEDVEKDRVNCSRLYHALYLDSLTYRHLVERMADQYQLRLQQISSIRLRTSKGIQVAVTDNVVHYIPDQSRYLLELVQGLDSCQSVSIQLKEVDDE